MIDLDTFETIKSRLKKLDAMINDRAATKGEKENAQRMRDQLLERYDLSEDDVSNRCEMKIVIELERAPWGRQLFLQCAAWMLQVSPVPIFRSPRGFVAMELNPLDAADLRACYGYYVREMRIRERAIADTRKIRRDEIAAAMKKLGQNQAAMDKELDEEKIGLLDALVHRYDLRGPRTGEPLKRSISEAEIQEYLKRRSSADKFKSDAWRQGEKLDGDETFRLTA